MGVIRTQAQRWLREGARLDRLLASPALRAAQTAEICAEAIAGISVTYDEVLYGAEGTELLRHIRTWDATWQEVAIVGHQPGLGELALLLVGNALGQRTFAPATLLALGLDIPQWSALHPGQAQVLYWLAPPAENTPS